MTMDEIIYEYQMEICIQDAPNTELRLNKTRWVSVDSEIAFLDKILAISEKGQSQGYGWITDLVKKRKKLLEGGD